jgi:hypothetical protein
MRLPGLSVVGLGVLTLLSAWGLVRRVVRRLTMVKRSGIVAAIALMLASVAWLVVGPSSSRGAPGPRAAVRSPACGGGAESLFGIAGRGKLISQADVPICVTGRVIVTFAGDQATGCVSQGLCAYSGTETWEPQGIGDLGVETVTSGGRRSTDVTLGIGGGGSPVLSTVARAGATTTGTCRGRAAPEAGFFTLPLRGGMVDVGLDNADQPVFGTQCAGPLDSDLAAALPHRTVSLGTLLRGHARLDLSGSAPFTAGGFSGTVTSTLVLALGRPQTERKFPTPPVGSTPTRLTSVRYRITGVAGQATAAFRASATTAACARVDACGAQGTIAIASDATSGASARLTAISRKPRSQRDLLTALGVDTGGNPGGIAVVGGGELTRAGTETSTLTEDGATCTDHVALGETGIVLRTRANRLIVTEMPLSSQAADPLRSRCPGPALGRHPLASASLPRGVLHRDRFTVKLHGESFSTAPYQVTTHSTLTVTLQRGLHMTLRLRAASRKHTGRPRGGGSETRTTA